MNDLTPYQQHVILVLVPRFTRMRRRVWGQRSRQERHALTERFILWGQRAMTKEKTP